MIRAFLVLASVAIPLAAQSAGERSAIDSVFTELARAVTVESLADAGRCSAFSGVAEHLCLGALAAKHADLTDDRDAALTADHELRQVVQAAPDWAAGWYALGIARVALARTGVTARQGPLQPLGVSWVAGAGHALVRALELDSTLTGAATALAMIPIPREGASQLDGRLAMLRRVRPLLGVAAMAGAARVERVAGSRDSAAVLWRRVLDRAVLDSGAVAVELTRDLFAAGHPEEGTAVLLAGAASETEEGVAVYRRELSWVAEPAELLAWDSTPPAERPTWLRQFWAGRDVREGWPDGARLIEHYRRVERAWKEFTLALPPSGRQRSASTTGGIDTFVDELIEHRLMGREGLNAELGVETGRGSQTIGTARLLLGQYQALGLDGPFRAFRTTQDVLDDRGIVWIRYGEPTRMVSSSGGEALQVWAYDQFSPPLILQFREENFDGQAGASRLVPSLINIAGRFRDQFCGIEQSLCAVRTTNEDQRYDDSRSLETSGLGERYAQTLLDGGRVNTAVVDRVVREGEAQIARATTTDAAPRPFTASVAPLVQLYGLRGAEPLALAAFAIPGEQLLGTQPPAAGGRTVYSVRMVLALLDAEGRRTDIDTVRHFAVPRPLGKGEYLTGTLEAPIPTGRYQGSLLLTQDDGRGAVASLPGIGVPGAGGTLTLSSIVLGREGSGAAWRAPSGPVALNPLGAFPEKGSAELYYQVAEMTVGAEYATTLEFLAADRPEESALTLTFTDTARERFAEVQRSVGLANLKPGRYRLRVTVTGAGRTAVETAVLTVVKGS